jgi:hypothetical protein
MAFSPIMGQHLQLQRELRPEAGDSILGYAADFGNTLGPIGLKPAI